MTVKKKKVSEYKHFWLSQFQTLVLISLGEEPSPLGRGDYRGLCPHFVLVHPTGPGLSLVKKKKSKIKPAALLKPETLLTRRTSLTQNPLESLKRSFLRESCDLYSARGRWCLGAGACSRKGPL